MERLLRWDADAFVLLNEKLRSRLLDSFMSLMSSGPFWILVMGVLAAWFWCFEGSGGRRAVLKAGLGAVLAYLAEHLIKFGIKRPRPFLAVHGARLLLEFKNSPSFPSGHAAVAFAIALTAARFYPRRALWWLGWALLVSYTRVYVGEHYPLDVLGGALLGLVVAALSWFVPIEEISKGFARRLLRKLPEPKGAIAKAGAAALLSAAAIYATASAAWRIDESAKRLDDQAAALLRQSRELTRITDGVLAQSREIEFLQGLPNLLPKDKGYLRTQKAILDDVEALERKLAWKLKNRLYLVIDSKVNKLYVKKGFASLWEADCSVGRGNYLVDKNTGRRWQFATPRGEFHVLAKAKNPLWRRPDWAFVEAREPIPPPDDPSRYVRGVLGQYVLSLGDGYLIHGLQNEKLLGRSSSHGCVRVGADSLEKLYDTVPLGTLVYIF